MSDLLPCPFCGGKAELSGDFSMWFVQCVAYLDRKTKCPCPSARGEHIEEAKTNWNTRCNQGATDGLLASMALRYRHDFGILPADEQRTIMAIMRQIHEEVVGKGFYSAKDEDKFKRALNYE